MRPVTRASRSWRPDSEAARTGTARGGRRPELSEPSVRVAKRPSWSHRTVVRRGRGLAGHSTGDDDMVGVVDGKRLRAASVSGVRRRAHRASGESVIPGARWSGTSRLSGRLSGRPPTGRASYPALVRQVAALLLHGSFRPVPRRRPLRFAYPAPSTGDRGFALPSCRSCSGAQEKGGGAVRAPPPMWSCSGSRSHGSETLFCEQATPWSRRMRQPCCYPGRTSRRTCRPQSSERRRCHSRRAARPTRQRRQRLCHRSSTSSSVDRRCH